MSNVSCSDDGTGTGSQFKTGFNCWGQRRLFRVSNPLQSAAPSDPVDSRGEFALLLFFFYKLSLVLLFFIATPIKTYRSLWVAAVVRGLVAPQRRRTKPEKYAQTFESKRFRIQRKWKFPRFFFSVPLNRKRILLFKLSRFFFSTYALNKQWELFLFLFSPFALFVIPFPFWLNYNKSDDASESGTGYELQGLAVRNKALGSTIPLNQF